MRNWTLALESGRPMDKKEADSSLKTRKNSGFGSSGKLWGWGMEQKTGLVENLCKEQLETQILLSPPHQPDAHPSLNQTETGSLFSEEKGWPQNVRQSSGQKRCHVLKTDFEMNVCSRYTEPRPLTLRGSRTLTVRFVLHRKETGGFHSRETGMLTEKTLKAQHLRNSGNVCLNTQGPFVNCAQELSTGCLASHS